MVTSGAVYNKIKTFSTFTKYVATVPYLLLFDITNWWNATSSNPVNPIYIVGTVLLNRRGGWTQVDVAELGLQVSYYPLNIQSYANSLGSKIYCRNLANVIKAGIVEYNNRYYLALKNFQDGVDIDFIGRMSGTPLLTEVASATEIYMTA